jgi:hypothetical protein
LIVVRSQAESMLLSIDGILGVRPAFQAPGRISIGRYLYEAFIAVVFVSCYRDDANAVIKAARGERTFNVTNFVSTDLILDDWVL